TATEAVLQKGAGHVHGSSLPVGGESTHTALSAHRGLPGASLFTDIDQLQEGDQFYLYILDDILAYEVDQIIVVQPSDTDDLNVEEGRDYATLITCTPYGINSHRLLVRGHRVPYEEEKEVVQQEQVVRSVHTDYGFWIMVGLSLAGVCMFITWIVIKVARSRKRRNSKTISRNL
ncbi:MAG: class C sortase, partial [Lachnospiraceae bacterium]|nr:class C sortase [Lachnospiraceae bacterium]